MKKKVFITLITLCIISVTVFLIDISNKSERMYIKASTTKKMENTFINLLNGYDNSNYRIFETYLDGNVKSMKLKFYTLHTNGKWLKTGESITDINHSVLVAFVDFNVDGDLTVAYGNDKNLSFIDINYNTFINNTIGNSIISINKKDYIEYGKEIPLLIQASNNETSSTTNFNIDNFYITDVFKEYEKVNAITVVFSDKTKERLLLEKER